MALMTGASRTFPLMDRHRRTELPSDNILRIMHHFPALLFLSVYSPLLCISLLYSHSHDSCHHLFFLISSSVPPPIYHQGFFFFSFFWHNLHTSNIIFSHYIAW